MKVIDTRISAPQPSQARFYQHNPPYPVTPFNFPVAQSGHYEFSYPDVFSATNSFTAAASGSIAGSPSCRIWLRPGKPRNLAPGMPAANSTPNLNGTALSSRQ